MWHRAWVFLAAISLSASCFGEVVDQSNVLGPSTTGSTWHFANDRWDVAQTFRAGLTGSITRIDLQLGRRDATLPLTIDVRPTTVYGTPEESDGAVLFSASIAYHSIPEGISSSHPYTSVDLSASPIPVTEGDVLAIVLRSDAPYQPALGGYYWRLSPQGQNTYLNGSGFGREFGTWYQLFDQDAAFRTYVEVPEPGGAAAALVVLFASVAVGGRSRAIGGNESRPLIPFRG